MNKSYLYIIKSFILEFVYENFIKGVKKKPKIDQIIY